MTRPLIGLLSRFGLVGIGSTITYLTVANLLLYSGFLAPAKASVAAYLAGMVVSFIGQSWFTFRVAQVRLNHFVRFGILSVLGLAFSYGSVVLALKVGAPPFAATIATAIFVPLLSFVIMRYWVFLND
ncbi:GtrA family protein [Mesorhizobium sp. NBSH29]|uniref:GtrA family protein n=1 Tax=Mesorhizobium sp. NBSH29 TaxID=2654249 RepID=UPI0018967E1D|nr:GtrA family protein [Mesorhizobium sp. NBSH29]